MKKEHIRKKKERKLFERINEDFGSITEENFDTYPIGNPYAKPLSKAARKELKKIITESRAKRALEQTPEEREEHLAFVAKIQAEGRAEDLLRERIRIGRIFRVKKIPKR